MTPKLHANENFIVAGNGLFNEKLLMCQECSDELQ